MILTNYKCNEGMSRPGGHQGLPGIAGSIPVYLFRAQLKNNLMNRSTSGEVSRLSICSEGSESPTVCQVSKVRNV